jgi:hypothetical protein
MSSTQRAMVMNRLDAGIATVRENRAVMESASRSIQDSRDTIFMNNALIHCAAIEKSIGDGVNELRAHR